MYSTGEKPGKGEYYCTNCGQNVTLDQSTDTLPPCPRCSHTNFRKGWAMRESFDSLFKF